MNKNMLIVMGGGFVIAVFVSVLMISIMKPGAPPPQEIAVVSDTSSVLIATKALKAGERLSPDNTRWASWPNNVVFQGMVVKKSDDKDAGKGRVNRAVNIGEPILKNALVSNSPNLLAASLEKGKRAVALSVNAASTAGGFITPGDRVDVIVTFAIRPEEEAEAFISQFVDRYISETVLENVRVLAIDQQAQKPENGSQVGRTVTLEVDNKGARQLMLSREMGELSLALRALGDDKTFSDNEDMVTDVTTAKIFGDIAQLLASSPVSSSHSVRILNNSGVSFVSPAISQRPPPPSDERLTQRFN